MCRNVTPQEAYAMIQKGGVEVLDVRTPQEYYGEGHIKGAKLIPLSELQHRLRELNPAKRYLIYCRTGHRSAQACRLLSQLGFETYNQLGGIVQWARLGLPVEGVARRQRGGFFNFNPFMP
ncbi:MAG: rhodanese-like domain-containing protein [Euryarchaeota archaeon]|nr:rhodanese-like domain-containing protein [Euryarchaeota archaeon]